MLRGKLQSSEHLGLSGEDAGEQEEAFEQLLVVLKEMVSSPG
jgi:hypothetical protein